MPEQLNRFFERSTCSVRPPDPRDYGKIADLAGQLGYPSTAKQVQKRIDAMANSSQHAVYVAELPEGQIAGWIGLYVFRSVEQDSCVIGVGIPVYFFLSNLRRVEVKNFGV